MESEPNQGFEAPPVLNARRSELQRRVAEAARNLIDRGIRPTNHEVRVYLGGGSPNEIAPALKAWRESPAAGHAQAPEEPLRLPIQVADLALELWQRATMAAQAQSKGGATSRRAIVTDTETEAHHALVKALRDQLEHELLKYGELRAQASRHEAVARDAIARLEAAESRERKHLRDLGEAKAQIADLEARLEQKAIAVSVRSRVAKPAPAKPGKPPLWRKKRSTSTTVRVAKAARAAKSKPRGGAVKKAKIRPRLLRRRRR